jgi:hypothetical protein
MAKTCKKKAKKKACKPRGSNCRTNKAGERSCYTKAQLQRIIRTGNSVKSNGNWANWPVGFKRMYAFARKKGIKAC